MKETEYKGYRITECETNGWFILYYEGEKIAVSTLDKAKECIDKLLNSEIERMFFALGHHYKRSKVK